MKRRGWRVEAHVKKSFLAACARCVKQSYAKPLYTASVYCSIEGLGIRLSVKGHPVLLGISPESECMRNPKLPDIQDHW